MVRFVKSVSSVVLPEETPQCRKIANSVMKFCAFEDCSVIHHEYLCLI